MDSKYKSMCRVCLQKRHARSLIRSLADQHTRDLFFECTSLWVQPDDKYPQQLCTKCWNKLKSYSDFKALVKENEQRLKTELEEVDKKEEQITRLNVAPLDTTLVQDERLQQDEEKERITKVKEEPLDDEEEFVNIKQETLMDVDILKEEPLEYLTGYSVTEVELPTDEPLDCDAEIDGNVEKETSQRESSKVQSLSTSNKLKCHSRAHSNENPFSCDQFEKKYKSKENLLKHKLIDGGVKRFKCERCKLKFFRRPELEMHQKSHPKLFQCDECEMTFRLKANLQQHKTIHATLFECDECNQKFINESLLTHHRKSHALASHLRTTQNRAKQ